MQQIKRDQCPRLVSNASSRSSVVSTIRSDADEGDGR